jgi:integrase
VAGADGDLLTVAVGTGLRFGEVTALWVSDVDLVHRTIRINKAWKRDGENDVQETPSWLRKSLGAKHQMRGHHLGNPKTPKSRRTVTISSEIARLLSRLVEGKAADDFVFVTPTGRPIHNADFYERVWYPLMKKLPEAGVPPFRFHDLRHTHVAWLVAGGAPLPHIQARLGHESITTTIDTYGHLLPVGDELIADIIDTALRGGEIRPAMRLISGGSAATKS